MEQISQQWASDLWSAICEYSNLKGISLGEFPHTIGITPQQWEYIQRGQLVLNQEDTEAYAKIHSLIGLPEADPTRIPTNHTQGGQVVPHAWSAQEYVEWIYEQLALLPATSADNIQVLVNHPLLLPKSNPIGENTMGQPDHGRMVTMSVNKDPWALGLSVAFKAFCHEHGLVPHDVAMRMGITKGQWQRISAANAIVSDPKVYAKLYLFTDLDEANPLRIPSQNAPVFGKASEKVRSMSEEEWQKWLGTPEAKGILAMKAELFPQESAMESKTPDTPTTQHPMMEDDVQFLASMTEYLRRRVVNQVVEAVMPRVTDEIVAQAELIAEAVGPAVATQLSLQTNGFLSQLQQLLEKEQKVAQRQSEVLEQLIPTLSRLTELLTQLHGTEEKQRGTAGESRASPEASLENDLHQLARQFGGEIRKLASVSVERRDAVLTEDFMRLLFNIWPWFDALSQKTKEQREEKLRFMLGDQPTNLRRRI